MAGDALPSTGDGGDAPRQRPRQTAAGAIRPGGQWHTEEIVWTKVGHAWSLLRMELRFTYATNLCV